MYKYSIGYKITRCTLDEVKSPVQLFVGDKIYINGLVFYIEGFCHRIERGEVVETVAVLESVSEYWSS